MTSNGTHDASRDTPEIPQLLYTTLEGADGCRVILPTKAAESSRLLKHLLKGLAVFGLEQYRKGSLVSGGEKDNPSTSEGHRKKEKEDVENDERNGGFLPSTSPYSSSLFLPTQPSLSSSKNPSKGSVKHPKGLVGKGAASLHKRSDNVHDHTHRGHKDSKEDRFRCFAVAPCTHTAVRHGNRRAFHSANEKDSTKGGESKNTHSSPTVGHSSNEGGTSGRFFSKSATCTPVGSEIIAQVSSVVIPLPNISFRTLGEVAAYLVFSVFGRGNTGAERHSIDDESEEFFSHNILHSLNMDSTEDRKEVKRILLAADFFQC